MDYKVYLGYLAVLVGFIGYIPYLKDIFKGRTKPHLFSWLMWGLVESIILAIQINQHAGAGVYVTAFTALICFIIAGLSVKRGIKEFLLLDWLLLGASIFSIILWVLTENPLGSTILLIITDATAFAITFRKTFKYPQTETLFEYFCASLKSLIAIFALQTYNLNTWLFFAYLVFANAAFLVMTFIRKKQLAK